MKIFRAWKNNRACVVLVLIMFSYPIGHAIVPGPAVEQSEPIAFIGATIHVGDGTIIYDGVLTFTKGLITAVGTADDNIDLFNHRVIDLQGQHLYPGFILPNTVMGLLEIENIRATDDVTEEGDINASVRSAIAYNTDSEIIPTQRFNGILTAQITPRGGLISGLSTVVKLDGWNWEDAVLKTDDGMHMHWPALTSMKRNEVSGDMEKVENEYYAAQTQLLHSLFQNSRSYTGATVNLNLAAMQGLFTGEIKLFIHSDEAKEIISSIRFARAYGVREIVLVGGRDAMKVKDLLLAESIPVIYQAVHELPGMEWHDIDLPFKTPALLHDAGIKVGISSGLAAVGSQRNLPFFAGTAAAYGLDRETALSMVTRNNAEILGVDDRVGTLEEGKDATLFTSLGDALDMRTSQVQQVFIQGREVDLYGTQQELYERFYQKYSDPGLE
jgi:imidazolonepropionase-like amidohydrolase